MARHTTFRFCLDPTVEQSVALARHVGAARFAFNQCLRLHLDARERHRALSGRSSAHDVDQASDADQAQDGVPWSRFSLINTYNRWKRSEAAGRRFLVTGDGVVEVEAIGLASRAEVSSQVSEEAAVDLSRGLAVWTASRTGQRKGRPVGHPRFKLSHHLYVPRTTSRAAARSAGYSDSTSIQRPVVGCSKPSRRACSHCRVSPTLEASTGSAP
jgi:putative transposase